MGVSNGGTGNAHGGSVIDLFLPQLGRDATWRTLSAHVWCIRRGGNTGTQAPMGAQGNSGGGNYGLNLRETQTGPWNRAEFVQSGAQRNAQIASAQISASDWTSWGATLNVSNGEIRNYIDGVEVALATSVAVDVVSTQTQAGLRIFGRMNGTNPTESFGLWDIAEIAFWHEELTLADMQSLAGGTPANQVGTPQAYYPMTSSTDVADAMGNYADIAYQGTISNSATHPPISGGPPVGVPARTLIEDANVLNKQLISRPLQ